MRRLEMTIKDKLNNMLPKSHLCLEEEEEDQEGS